MKVLVTGASGFIGVNMSRYLLDMGHEVVFNYRSNFPDEIKNILSNNGEKIIFLQGDLLDKKFYKKLESENIDSIIHAAVVTSPNKKELEVFSLMATVNIQSTVNLLDFSIENNIKNFVYVSSSGVYGAASDVGTWVKEDDELDLFSTYCIAKYSSELLVQKYASLTGRKGVTGRIAAPYGPFERVTASRMAMSPIYKLVYMALEEKKAKIYGKDVVRDWTYVGDTVKGLYNLLVSNNLKHHVYNVSASKSISLQEIAEAIQEVIPTFEYELTEDIDEADVFMRAEMQRGNLDITRLSEDTKFSPNVNLVDGIEKYIEWAKTSRIK